MSSCVEGMGQQCRSEEQTLADHGWCSHGAAAQQWFEVKEKKQKLEHPGCSCKGEVLSMGTRVSQVEAGR